MAPTRITITLEASEYATPDDVARALLAVQGLSTTPLGKVALTLECHTIESIEATQNAIDTALASVPMGIDITIKTVSERGVERRTHTTLPLDFALRN